MKLCKQMEPWQIGMLFTFQGQNLHLFEGFLHIFSRSVSKSGGPSTSVRLVDLVLFPTWRRGIQG